MDKAFIEYNLDLKTNSRLLRNNSTLSEVLLWKKIRAGNMMGFKFNRQKLLGNYIVDFYCKALNLVIEIDGSSHDNKYEKDLIRQIELEKLGVTLIRFTDLQVKKDMNNVIRGIEMWIDEKK
ncbi:MAG: endonuclease domain-containing protein [Bacteroidia bacterium]